MVSTPFASLQLPVPEPGRGEAETWVARHMAGLFCEDEVVSSQRFRGGQSRADSALESLDITGYANNRNEAYPVRRRGATGLSPYIRHGLISLGRAWDAAAGAPAHDAKRFRDELLWQEFARHWYARLGSATGAALRKTHPDYEPGPDHEPRSTGSEATGSEVTGPVVAGSAAVRASGSGPMSDAEVAAGWDQDMACLELTMGELEDDGWLVNQTRMWLASHWTVRNRLPWRDGEDHFFRHLLDGSRAANRLGWQWTAGIGSDRPYGFSRWQVEKRAPGLCASCEVAANCPVYGWPDEPELIAVEPNPLLKQAQDYAPHYGPRVVRRKMVVEPNDEAAAPDRYEEAQAVWLTAESLGMADPALVANLDCVAVFVFDRRLLANLQLSSKRLVFMVESLAELALHRPLEVHLGDPVDVLAGLKLAATFAPVPGWAKRAAKLNLVEVHPWPWLRTPTLGPVGSFNAWSKDVGQRDRLP